jgi:hypothetical protein
VLLYLAADQLLCLPIAVLGRASPLRAVQSGRAAIDPHWLQALGLALVAANVVLATLYLAGATVTDWARIAGAARGLPKSGEGGS